MSRFLALPEELYTRHDPALGAAGPDFAMGTARALAWAAQLAYETADPDKAARVLNAWNWRLHGNFAGRVESVLPLTSAKGFIASSDGLAVLAFAGTDPLSLADWIVDFLTRRDPDGIHQGFQVAIDSVWSQLFATLGEAAADRILIVGHSLGAALAIVAAHRLAPLVGPDRLIGVYTFGTPRVGDDRFAQDYGTVAGGVLPARTYRLIDGADIVTQVPPPEAPFGFRHVGRALACPSGGVFEPASLGAAMPEQPPAQSLLSDLLNRLSHPPAPVPGLPGFPGSAVPAAIVNALPPPLRDHIMDRYLRAAGVL